MSDLEIDHKINHKRRRLLIGGAILAGSVGATGIAGAALHARGPSADAPAYRYWRQRDKAGMTDTQYIVMCGSLAANAHNTQPWKFEARGRTVRIFADLSRNIGQADADRRQMAMSLGCASENMLLAATHLGYTPTLTEFGSLDGFRRDGYCASLHLEGGGAMVNAPLFDAIFARQTTRVPFDRTQPVPAAFRTALEDAVAGDRINGVALNWFETEQAPAAAELCKQSVRAFLAVRARHRDGMQWFRCKRAEWEAKGDGLAIFTSDAPFYVKDWVENFATSNDLVGESFRQGEIDSIDRIAPATAQWGVIWAARTDLASRLQGGRLLERAYLEAASRGLALHPISYPAEDTGMAMRFKQSLNIPLGAEILTTFRVGVGALQEKSVRRPLKEILV